MSISRPPLRAAFWAISAALLLMLLLTISDPYATRQTILAHHAAGASQPAAMPPEIMVARQESVPTHNDVVTGSSEVDDVLVPLPPGRPRYAQTTTVSTVLDGESDTDSSPDEFDLRPSMPILTPGNRNSSERRREFVELPPPPGMELEADQLVESSSPSAERRRQEFSQNHNPATTESAEQLERIRLEAEMLTLRHDLTRMADDRRLKELGGIHQRQEALLDHQIETAARLDRLAEQITTHTARLEALLDRSIATHDEMKPVAVPSHASGEPQLTTSADGRERFSLIIESDDVSGVLDRLGHWSRESSDSIAVSSVSLQPVLEPVPPTVAVPDCAPLTTVSEAVPPARETTAGPTFAPGQPPCNCR